MRLDDLDAQRGDVINLQWRSFLLRPEPKAPNQTKFVEYTKSWLRPGEAEPGATFNVWASEEEQPSSSVPAQVAAKLVEALAPDRSGAYKTALLRAYFSDNRNISRQDVLLDVAESVGVEATHLRDAAASSSETIHQAVIDEHNQAIAMGISAVPTVVFSPPGADIDRDDQSSFAVPGAQPAELYVRVVDKMLAKY